MLQLCPTCGSSERHLGACPAVVGHAAPAAGNAAPMNFDSVPVDANGMPMVANAAGGAGNGPVVASMPVSVIIPAGGNIPPAPGAAAPAPRADKATINPTAAPNYDQDIPRHLGAGSVLSNRYEILHMIGQGGMGTVYMARDLRLKGRACVVKKLRDDFYNDNDRQKAQEFFQREMDVLAELQHRNIVQILDFFPEGDDFYLVMEYVQGSNLHQMLHADRSGSPFTENSVIEWALQICDVLSYLHCQNPPIIYRDLKPSNVMIDTKGEVKLVDFGIARREESGEQTHVISAGYSPPEQYWGSVDIRSDIYSLGATMYFLLTGKDPDALHQLSPRSINPEVSEFTDSLVRKATAQDLAERFQTAEEFLESLLHKDYIPAPESPRSRVGEIVAGLVLLVVALFIFVIQSMPTLDQQKPQTQMLMGETDVVDPRDQASQLQKTTAASATATQDRSDLAVQMTDERQLTDPDALSESTATKSPTATTSRKAFLLNLFNQK